MHTQLSAGGERRHILGAAGGAAGGRVPRWRDGLAVMGHADGVAPLGRVLALFGDADGAPAAPVMAPPVAPAAPAGAVAKKREGC